METNLTYGLPEDEAVDVPGEHGQSVENFRIQKTCSATYLMVVVNGTKQWKENRTYGLPEDEAVDIPGEHGRSGEI
jgi:hypothetical protein